MENWIEDSSFTFKLEISNGSGDVKCIIKSKEQMLHDDATISYDAAVNSFVKLLLDGRKDIIKMLNS